MRAARDRLTAQLAELVAIESVTGHERAAQQHLAGVLDDDGLAVELIEVDPEALAADPDFPGYEVDRDELVVVVGRHDTGRPGPRRLLVGHIDVVPPGDPASWTSPAFEPRLDGGLLYGRGSCDMKGGLIAELEALRLARDSGRLTGEVLVVSVPSEEDGGAGALAAIRAGCVGDACVITEPTELRVVVAQAGSLTFTLRVPGRAAHASMRREGQSALDKLMVIDAALKHDEAERNADESDPHMAALGLPYPTIIGQVAGGVWASSVMDGIVAHGRYGVRLGQSAAEAAEDLRAAVTRAWTADEFLSQYPIELEVWGGRFDSARLADDHPLTTALVAAHRSVTGAGAELAGLPAGTDMRLFLNQGHTPTVLYGPGSVAVAHTADEHVPVDEVVTCAEVLAQWLIEPLG